MSLEKLAESVGSTKSYMWELENKPTIRPSADLVHRIAQQFQLTVEALLTGVESPSESVQVFFREYQTLNRKDQERLMVIMKGLKGVADP